jgi:hypothetical protein
LLFETIIPHGFSQHVSIDTPSWPGQQPSCIDHLYTNKPDKLSDVSAHVNGGSDHKVVYVVWYAKAIKRNVRYIRKRCFKHFDESGFKQAIVDLKWFDVYNSYNVDVAVKLLTDKITAVLDKFAPVKTIQVKPNYAPWLTDQVKEVMKERDRGQLVAGISQCQDSWRLYRSLRNFASQCIKNAKKGWETLQLDSLSN